MPMYRKTPFNTIVCMTIMVTWLCLLILHVFVPMLIKTSPIFTLKYVRSLCCEYSSLLNSFCEKKAPLILFLTIQSTLDISNSDISNSAKLEASFWIKTTFWLLSSTIIWRWKLFYKSKLPEVQINLHFG